MTRDGIGSMAMMCGANPIAIDSRYSVAFVFDDRCVDGWWRRGCNVADLSADWSQRQGRLPSQLIGFKAIGQYYKVTSVDSVVVNVTQFPTCLLYTSPSPRDATLSRMPSSA